MIPLVPLQAFGFEFFLVIVLTVGSIVALWVWITFRMRESATGPQPENPSGDGQDGDSDDDHGQHSDTTKQ